MHALCSSSAVLCKCEAMPHLFASVQLAVDAAVRVQLTNSALLYSALIAALRVHTRAMCQHCGVF
jgi:hypothetical protein